MALRHIVLYPDDPLTKRAEPLLHFGPETDRLIQDMFEAMDAYDGCGLAGPQVGVSKRILVFREAESGVEMCLINPELSEFQGGDVAEEGCLSLPNVFAEVTRSTQVRVRALDPAGAPLDFEAAGLAARIIQHEVDHLDGIMFIDRVDLLTREAKLHEWAAARERLRSALSHL